MRIEWSEERFGTGVQVLDNQHKELFRGINALLDALEEGRAADEVRQMLAFLGRYTMVHFAEEEREMEEQSCPALQKNIEDHRHFAARYDAFRRAYETEGPNGDFIVQFRDFLVIWLARHIHTVDTQLHADHERD